MLNLVSSSQTNIIRSACAKCQLITRILGLKLKNNNFIIWGFLAKIPLNSSNFTLFKRHQLISFPLDPMGFIIPETVEVEGNVSFIEAFFFWFSNQEYFSSQLENGSEK